MARQFSINRLLSRLATLAALLLAAHGAAVLTWELVAPGEPATVAIAVGTDHGGADPAAPAVDLGEAIAGRHLFGEPAATRVVAVAPVREAAPDTRLDLTLKGVFWSSHPDDDHAIIADASGHDRHYRPGDELPGNATLTEVRPDHVILTRNGRREALRLPKRKLGAENISRDDAGARPGSGRYRNLSDYRDALIEDPRRIAELAAVTPARSRGRLIGYRLTPGADRDLFDRLGLRTGDVVTSVNGVSLSNPAEGFRLLGQIAESDALSVEVLRGGQTVKLDLRID